jgi:NTP pyrophosphatase (non-canonical NTP hydrolase)
VSVFNDHARLVERTCKLGEDIKLAPHQTHLVHMMLGLAGEVGELVDAIKKSVIYGKTLNEENVKEELGDIEWYLEGLRKAFDITREDVLKYNINKLNKRYPVQYTDADAQARKDKE